MKVLFIILGIMLLLLFLLLFLPVSVYIKFKEKFHIKIHFCGIKLFETKTEQKKEQDDYKKSDSEKPKAKNKNEIKSLWNFLKEKHGFKDAVKTVLGFTSDLLSHIKKFLRHIKIEKVKLNLIIASSDAAKTAIEYGEICSAIYPITAFLQSYAKINFKNINISTDFTSEESHFDFSAAIRLRVFFLLIAAFRCYNQYEKFILKENYNERKQH